MQAIRDKQLAKARESLWQDLQETERMIGDAARLDLFTPQDKAGFETRLERLRRSLHDDSDVSAGTVDLERLRSAVLRSRERETQRIRTRLNELSPDHSPKPGGWVMDFSKG